MDHKCCVHFTIISHFVDLDQILETDDVGDSLLAKPYPELVSRQLAFLKDPETPPLLVILRAFNAVFTEDVNFLLQHRSKVLYWLSKKRTFLRSNPINFFNFSARAILG
jgi:hypothetical protein